MANIRAGSIVADIRGSVGTETYARNRYGPYVRNRITPTDHKTAAQLACRAAMTALSQAWSATLTDQQRADWRRYANQFPTPDAWGNPKAISGICQFVSCNYHHYQLLTAIGYPDAPAIPPLHPPTLVFSIDSAVPLITVPLPLGGYPVPQADTRYFLFSGHTVNSGVNFFNGPWRRVSSNTYESGWAADPWTATHWEAAPAGQKVFAYCVVQDMTSGAISNRGRSYAIAT